MRFRMRQPDPLDPEAVVRLGWKLQEEAAFRAAARLSRGYSFLEGGNPGLLEMDLTPSLLADMHRRLQKLEG